MAAEAPLERLQRWMQEVVVHPGSIERALISPSTRAQLPAERLVDVVLPSATLTPAERLEIYHGMYLLRMEEALETDYPVLKRFLGPRAFQELVAGYVQVYPSRSYSLNPLGRHLPDFIKVAPNLKRRGFTHDLAHLEWAMTEVFDAPETPVLSPRAVRSLASEKWETARLDPIAAFRLLALRYPVVAYVEGARPGRRRRPALTAKENWVLVHRRNYQVLRLVLDRAAHDLLADLASGVPVGGAVTAALRRGRRPPTESQLTRWFRQWVARGVFQSVHPA
jgi:hypothetical protein